MVYQIFFLKINKKVLLLRSFKRRYKKIYYNMLIINVKEEESIDKALKRYKRKFQ